jgi:hypothetical protein
LSLVKIFQKKNVAILIKDPANQEGITKKGRHNIQHNNAWYNGTQRNDSRCNKLNNTLHFDTQPLKLASQNASQHNDNQHKKHSAQWHFCNKYNSIFNLIHSILKLTSQNDT